MLRLAPELLEIGVRCGASDIGLCGSVARGTDQDGSDIDFYVKDFHGGSTPEARLLANELVKEFRGLLAPFGVDVRGIPGWPVSTEHRASMLNDFVPIETLLNQDPI